MADEGAQNGSEELRSPLPADVEVQALAYEAALNSGDWSGLVSAMQGMVACGQSSLTWVRQALSGDDPDRRAAAASVLSQVEAPPQWEPWLQELVET